jgi:hypothetical protein
VRTRSKVFYDLLWKKLFGSKICRYIAGILLGIILILSSGALAAAATAPQNPQNGSIGLEGTVSGPPPSQPATITTPTNGQTFTSQPITVAGLCLNGLLIKVFSNNTFIGSTMCAGGSFSLQVTLFYNQNVLTADDYDNLGQAGPVSNSVTVSYNNPQLAAFGISLSLTSIYAKQGANPNQQISWPIIINGGTTPYALSIDWGDGGQRQLLSEASQGNVTLTHTYKDAGTYTITIQATDKNGETAFLQLVGLANGTKTQLATTTSPVQTVTKVIWWPAVVMLPLLLISFWLGQRYELFSLRRRIERSDEQMRYQ